MFRVTASAIQDGFANLKPGTAFDGLADAVAEGLADIGDVSVWCAEEPVTKVAEGALTLAGDMPDDQFTAIN